MAGSFKSITAKSITRHTAHKEYDLYFSPTTGTIQASASVDGVSALHLIGKQFPNYHANDLRRVEYSSSYWQTQTTDAPYFTGNGTDEYTSHVTQQDIFHSLHGRYYTEPLTPNFHAPKIALSGMTTHCIALPGMMIGDSIKPGSVYVKTGGGFNKVMVDDGTGMLLRQEYPYNLSSSRAHLDFTLFKGNQLEAIYKKPRNHLGWTKYTEHNPNGAPSQTIQGSFYNIDRAEVYKHTVFPNYFSASAQGYAGNSMLDCAYLLSHSNVHTDLYDSWHRENSQLAPSASVGFFDLPINCIPASTASFQGLTVFCHFVYHEHWAPDIDHKVVWQFGPGRNKNNSWDMKRTCLQLVIDGDDNFLKLQSIQGGVLKTNSSTGVTVNDGDSIACVVRIETGGTTHVIAMDHSANAKTTVAATASAWGREFIESMAINDPNDRTLIIGGGFEYGSYNYSNPETGQTEMQQWHMIHSMLGMELYDFKVWSCDIGVPAAEQLQNLQYSEVGNVFYEDGLIIASLTDSNMQFGNSDLTCSFKNTVEREEYEYTCMVADSEFNMSQNPTILQPGSSLDNPLVKDFCGSGDWDPYITTIGLYNEDNELLAIGKLGRPIRKVEHYDQTFIVRFDK